MSTDENIQIVQNVYAAFGAGDIPKMLGLMASDVVWEFPESKTIPWAGRFTGPDEVAQFFATLGGHSVPELFEPNHFVASGDHVVVLGHERFRVKSTGKAWECQWAHAVTLGEAGITSFYEYTDTAAVEAALR